MKNRLLFRHSPVTAFAFIAIATFTLAALQITISHDTAKAISATEFNAGKIIDNEVFYNKDSMNAQQIQDFLNRLLPNCDTWGTGTSEYGGGTRAQYAASMGWPGPPYVCLKNYHENPQTSESSYEKGGGAFSGGISAAQIIYNAAQQYGINPQVLLVLLKKESAGPLTADSWPLKSQYRYAMGYGCPDSGPGYSANCDSQKSGFYKQVNYAAWQLKYYKDHPNDYRYRIGSNQIQYSPDPICGTKTVNVQNIATLSLYIYTPYVPNDAALNNYPGTAPCGAYGNRNFYMFFREWFGTTFFNGGVENEKNAVWRLYNPRTGGHMFSSNYLEVNHYIVNGWKSDGVASHSVDGGTLAVYRLYNPASKYHTLTTFPEAERLEKQGWINDGVIFRANDEGTPVWRLSKSGHFFITNNANEAFLYRQDGWNIDGILYYELSEFEAQTWRLYSRTTGTHTFVSNANELTEYIRAGWKSDGVILSNSINDTVPVYRLWNGRSHFMTASESEKDAYVRAGWKNDGVIFKTTLDNSAVPVYRLWNGRSHFMTASESEKDAYVRAGWKNDGVIFKTNNVTLAYRLYSPSTGAHKVTVSTSELYERLNQGWLNDGSIFKASTSSKLPVLELSNPTTKSFFYTSNPQEADTYKQNGWVSNGVKFYAIENGQSVYRLYSPNSKTHILIQNESEKQAYINAGWLNDGEIFDSYN